VPDFADITRPEYDGLVAHMLGAGYLLETGSLLTFGPTAERVFGRKNFMELYAVFSSPVLYRVRTLNGRDLGSLEQAFVDRLVGGITSFLLAGRAWLAESVNHPDKVVRVIEAPKGREPSWGGFLPQFLSRPVCRAMRDVILSEDRYPYADDRAMAAVVEWRADLAETLRGSPIGLRLHGDWIETWTFAGGQINATLRAALEAGWGVKAVAGNLLLRVASRDIDPDTLTTALRALAQPATWENPDIRRRFSTGLPGYRLSKFQDALPAEAAWELIAASLLDEAGTMGYLAEAG
jgi:ATP-dependent Lhr-like helicase